jgi:hypothetical protein
MRSVPLIAICLILAASLALACAKQPRATSNAQNTNNTGPASTTDGGITSTITGLNPPNGWPSDLPIMPGLTIQHAGQVDGGLDVMLIGTVPLDQVEAFYSTMTGWTRRPENESEIPADAASNGKTFVMVRGQETLTVSMVTRDQSTSVRLLYVKG